MKGNEESMVRGKEDGQSNPHPQNAMGGKVKTHPFIRMYEALRQKTAQQCALTGHVSERWWEK